MDTIFAEYGAETKLSIERSALEIEDELLRLHNNSQHAATMSPAGIAAMNNQMYEKPGFDCINYPHESVATPPSCGNNCRICLAHYRPSWLQKEGGLWEYSEKLGDEEARETVQRLVTGTRANNQYVNQKLRTYGNAILKRWQRRNAPKRLALIRQTLPELHPKKWMRAQFVPRMLKKQKNKISSLAQYRSWWLLPSVDAQTLSEEPMHLLALLHYRTTFDQASWVMFDSREIRVSFNFGILQTRYNPHCIVMQRDSFGQLVQWKLESAHGWEIMGFPLAELVLEAQEMMSNLLRRVVDELLKDNLTDVVEGCDKWDNLVAASFKDERRAKQGSMALSAYCNPTFSSPPQFDIDKIVELLELRCRAVEDEIWLLQTDPEYVRQTLGRIKATTYYRNLSKDNQKRRITDRMVRDVYRLQRWQMAVNEARHVRTVWCRFAGQIGTTRALPLEYSEALRNFEFVLAAQFNNQFRDLVHLSKASAAFGSYYSFENGAIQQKLTQDELFHKDPLFWNILEIAPLDNPFSHDPWFHFVFIDDILSQVERKKGSKIDQDLYDHIADLAAVDEVFSALRCHRPRPMPFKSLDQFRKQATSGPWRNMFSKFLLALQELRKEPLPLATSLTPIIEEVVNQKSTGKFDDNTLTAFDASHKNLCVFWKGYRLALRQALLAVGCPKQDLDFHLDPISAVSRNIYREQFEDERGKIKNEIETQHQRDRLLHRPTPSKVEKDIVLQTQWGPTSEPERKSQYKSKIKSRPSNIDDSTTDADEPEAAEVEQDLQSLSIRPRLPVTSVSLQIFKRMFATYGARQGQIKWDDLVAAMADVGFSATHNGGSAVTFKDEAYGAGSIVIHKPHPDSSLDAVMLRSLGRRLMKWFNWSEDIFAERGKDGG